MRLLIILTICVVINASLPPIKVLLTQRTLDDRRTIQVNIYNSKIQSCAVKTNKINSLQSLTLPFQIFKILPSVIGLNQSIQQLVNQPSHTPVSAFQFSNLITLIAE